MDYTGLNISTTSPEHADIITAMLSDYPFDSFSQEGATLKAYIPTAALVDCKEQVDATLAGLDVSGHRYISIETRNWNSLWESNFEPVDVDGRCLIRAPFHEPREGVELEVVIMPKMSFGTGHHATTHLMTQAVMDGDFEGLDGLDMGSGTGVLAIVAVKRGAAHLDAVDIDEWAFENSVENIEANGCTGRVTPVLGNVSAIEGRSYDFILANINRNILLADMERYSTTLRPGGLLVVSGILEADIEAVSAAASKAGMKQCKTRLRDGWAAVEYKK